MSSDLILRSSCGCGSAAELYGSNCKHMTLCFPCGKKLAEAKSKCDQCGSPVTRLIREYNVRAAVTAENNKDYFIGRFATGLPCFPRKKLNNAVQNKTNSTKWSLQKEGLRGKKMTDALREKSKKKPWILEDGSGKMRYEGRLEGVNQTASYYVLIKQGKEFSAVPVGTWYNFNKVAQYKQILTLEEAEEADKKMKLTRRRNIKGLKKTNGDDEGDEEANLSDRDEDFNDDDNGAKGSDGEAGDEDMEKGDDWEHEDNFSDDDEQVGNDVDERDEEMEFEISDNDLGLSDDDDDEEENGDETEGGLSKAGKELKKDLKKLRREVAAKKKAEEERLRNPPSEEADGDNDDDDDNIKEEPKQKDAEESSASNSATGKRKLINLDDDANKASTNAPEKKLKIENPPTIVKQEASAALTSSGSVPPVGPAITEEEIRAVLTSGTRVTPQSISAGFSARLTTRADKEAFASTLKRIAKIHKTNGNKFIVLR